jgi:hypothetical protein
MAGVSAFIFTDVSLATALAGAGVEVYQQAEDLMLRVAQSSLEYARSNAPWEDRTGDARAGLNVDVQSDGDNIIMQLYHTVDYGLWLEVIQNGNFAIIMPTLQDFSLAEFDRLQAEGG